MDEDQEIIGILEPYYREILEQPGLKLSRSLSADDVETWDSLNHILLIVKCEEVLDIKFKAEELSDLINFGEFLDLIKRNRAS